MSGTGSQWSQDGTAVRVATPSLAPGAQQVLPFRGTYHGSNPLPAQFSLGDTQCEPIVVGVAAQPAPAAPVPRPDSAAAEPVPDGVSAGAAARGAADAAPDTTRATIAGRAVPPATAADVPSSAQ